MPYVRQEQRSNVDPILQPVLDWFKVNGSVGELNYAITRIIWTWWQTYRSYRAIAEISGVLKNVDAEFYRRVAVPYENSKMAENGDVYV